MLLQDIRSLIIMHKGSIAKLEDIPEPIKDLYRTVWEVKQKDLIDMAASRSAFVDQSCALNLFLERPTPAQLTSMHFYAWKRGLKTGMYVLRSKQKEESKPPKRPPQNDRLTVRTMTPAAGISS